ncbi:uncharacterized protein LOC128198295 [Bicyclus anynana]|uniref:Uncharacterized protein LOC128198295 n=1 Tax=Bicyclus anynana TaxID=110368 RepID=A0ABM3LI42_BICAN|nr:uncharacterized protein LOC128198295 [Bicyclus anynana]
MEGKIYLASLALIALSYGVQGQRYYNYNARGYVGRNLFEHGRSISDDQVRCGPSTCGVGAHCTHGSVRPVCACLPGYSGDPLSQCVKIECVGKFWCSGVGAD